MTTADFWQAQQALLQTYQGLEDEGEVNLGLTLYHDGSHNSADFASFVDELGDIAMQHFFVEISVCDTKTKIATPMYCSALKCFGWFR